MSGVNLLPLEIIVSILQHLPHPIRLRYAVISSTWQIAINMTVLTEEERDFYRKITPKYTRTFNGLTRAIKQWREFANTEVSYRTPPIPPTRPTIYPPPSSFGGVPLSRNASIKLAKARYRQHRIKYKRYQRYIKEYEQDPTFIEKLEANAERLRAKVTALNKCVNDSS